jgi:hypothetical protein
MNEFEDNSLSFYSITVQFYETEIQCDECSGIMGWQFPESK